MTSAGYDELLLLQASLVPEEFQWRGTAVETEAWQSAVAQYEQDGAAKKDTVHFSLRVNEALGVWMNVSLDVGGDDAPPGITVSATSPDVSLDALSAVVRERLADAANEGG